MWLVRVTFSKNACFGYTCFGYLEKHPFRHLRRTVVFLLLRSWTRTRNPCCFTRFICVKQDSWRGWHVLCELWVNNVLVSWFCVFPVSVGRNPLSVLLQVNVQFSVYYSFFLPRQLPMLQVDIFLSSRFQIVMHVANDTRFDVFLAYMVVVVVQITKKRCFVHYRAMQKSTAAGLRHAHDLITNMVSCVYMQP